jgi:hypothetical protein
MALNDLVYNQVKKMKSAEPLALCLCELLGIQSIKINKED